MKFRNFVTSFVILVPVLAALIVLSSILLIRYGDPGLTENRRHELGYNTLAHHRFTRNGCADDIILVGDSSLLMGVVPSVLEQRLNRKVVNLGLYATSGLSSYTLLLDNYLKRNKKPECIVFYFLASTPYHFSEHSYEKCYTLLKYGDPWCSMEVAEQVDATDCVRVACNMVSALWHNALHLDRARSRFRSDLAAMDEEKGFVKASFGFPLPQGYRFSTLQEQDLDLTFIRELKRRYQEQGIRVLYYVSPLPEGDQGLSFFRKAYSGIDNTVFALPNRYFADQRHLSESGARYNSEIFAEFLAGKLPRQPAPARARVNSL
jgi:hypothetical protein